MQVTLVPFGACVGFGAHGPPAGEPSTVQRRASWERTGRSVLGGAWPRGGSLQSPGNRLRGRNVRRRSAACPSQDPGILLGGTKIPPVSHPHRHSSVTSWVGMPLRERDREG